MITEELEKKLKISKDTCIHCTTKELAKQVLNIFHQLCLKWCSGNHYIRYTNWDSYREDTVYHPFEGEFSSLNYARLKGYKIINVEEFIALHTVKEKYNLENYEPKEELEGFPKEIIARMLDCQEEQGNPRNISVFERNKYTIVELGGFDWDKTIEKDIFWEEVIDNKNFDIFFKKYPKQDYQDNSQEFKVGDKVIYYITNKIGIIEEIKKHKFDNNIDIVVDFGNNDICEYEIGADIIRPFLLNYRNDYDYSIIDFNNLPERQKPKRWRAKEGEIYYSFTSKFKVEDFYDTKRFLDNKAYDSGNYFQTKEEAQEVADKLNKYLQELINPNK